MEQGIIKIYFYCLPLFSLVFLYTMYAPVDPVFPIMFTLVLLYSLINNALWDMYSRPS